MPYDNEVTMMMSVVPGAMTGISTMMGGLVSINNVFMDITRQIDASFGLIDTSIITASTVIAQFGLQAASAFGEFEQGMKVAQMVSGQTAQEMDYLKAKANEFSVSYRADIDQITEGLQTLGRAGLNSASEQTEVLENGLSTAKLEGRDLNGVLEELIQNTALLGGNLKEASFGEDSRYVNDLLVATSMTAPITTHDVSETLKYSGGIAAAAGANIETEDGKRILEDYMGAIAAFAQKGVTGSIAGTALRAFFNKPATQDSSVTDALESIHLKPEYLWEDDEETMKPVSEQIKIIKDQMEELNVSTMDQLQIWSKIVGGKMGQQMMKLDSDSIKELTKDIQSANDAESLAAGTFETYQAKMKEMTEQGQVAFRQFGQYVATVLTPILDVLKRVLEFFSNPIISGVVFVGAFRLVTMGISKIKNLFSALKNEFLAIKEAFMKDEQLYAMRPSYERFHGRQNLRTVDDYNNAYQTYDTPKAVIEHKMEEMKDNLLTHENIGPEEYTIFSKTRGWQHNSQEGHFDMSKKKLKELGMTPKSVNDAWIIQEAMRNDLWKPEWTKAFLDPEHFLDKNHIRSTVMKYIYDAVYDFYVPIEVKPKVKHEDIKKMRQEVAAYPSIKYIDQTKDRVRARDPTDTERAKGDKQPRLSRTIPDKNYHNMQLYLKQIKNYDEEGFLEYLSNPDTGFGADELVKRGSLPEELVPMYISEMQKMHDDRRKQVIDRHINTIRKEASFGSYNLFDVALLDDKLFYDMYGSRTDMKKEDLPEVLSTLRYKLGIYPDRKIDTKNEKSAKTTLDKAREQYDMSLNFEQKVKDRYGVPYEERFNPMFATEDDISREKIKRRKRVFETPYQRPIPAEALNYLNENDKYNLYEKTLKAHNGFVHKLDLSLEKRLKQIEEADKTWENINKLLEPEEPITQKDLKKNKGPHKKTADELRKILDDHGVKYNTGNYNTLTKLALPFVADWKILKGIEFGSEFDYEKAGFKTLSSMSYRDLSTLAQGYGIAGNLKRHVMEEELSRILPQINADFKTHSNELLYGEKIYEERKKSHEELADKTPAFFKEGHEKELEIAIQRDNLARIRADIMKSILELEKRESGRKLQVRNTLYSKITERSTGKEWENYLGEKEKEIEELREFANYDKAIGMPMDEYENGIGPYPAKRIKQWEGVVPQTMDEYENGIGPYPNPYHDMYRPKITEKYLDVTSDVYDPSLIDELFIETEKGLLEVRDDLTEKEKVLAKKLLADVRTRGVMERTRKDQEAETQRLVKEAEEYKENLSLLPKVGEGLYIEQPVKDKKTGKYVTETNEYGHEVYKYPSTGFWHLGLSDKFNYISEKLEDPKEKITGFWEKATRREGRLLGYEKPSGNLQKLANGALNAADMIGGPLILAMEAFSVVVNYIQSLYQEYSENLKNLSNSVKEAYSDISAAESGLKRTYREANPDATNEDVENYILDVYKQRYEDFSSGEWLNKATIKNDKELTRYEYDEETDNGSYKEKEEEEKTDEENQEEAIRENTGALYAATAQLQASMNSLVTKMEDGVWGVDGLSSTISDTIGGFQDHLFSWDGQGSGFIEEGGFLLTASQKDSNYQGYTEMAGLMLEDFHDANGNLYQGMQTMLGTDTADVLSSMNPKGQELLQNLANFSSNKEFTGLDGKKYMGLTRSENLKMQQSMKMDKKSWQAAAKELAKVDMKKKSGKEVTEKDTKRLEGYIKKLATETGLSEIKIKQGLQLQQLQDMYSVAQQVMVPLAEQQAHIAAQHLVFGEATAGSTDSTSSGANDTAAIASVIASYVAVVAQAKAGEAYFEAQRQKGDPDALDAKDYNEYLSKGYGRDISLDNVASNTPILGTVYGAGKTTGLTRFLLGDDLYASFNELTQKTAFRLDAEHPERFYGQMLTLETMGEKSRNPNWTDQQAQEYAEKKLSPYFDKSGNPLFNEDVISRMVRENYANAIAPSLVEQYMGSDIGEVGDEGSGNGSGSGDDGDKDKTGTKKERVDLVLCSKKEIPKLNVNLFKKPPTFTVLNKNFKVRDVKINTEDKPKAIMSAIKNSFIDVQKRSDPKIIQDEDAVYDPEGATDGNPLPSGSAKTKTD